MKLTIEVEPKEAAEFLAAFARASHVSCQLAEEQLVENIFRSMMPQKEKENKTKTEEVPAGGYFQ